MADTSRLIDWVLSRSGELRLRATTLKWVGAWLPGFYDYRIQIRVRGKDFAGRGIDSDEKTAFSKACAEAIERAMCWTLDAPAAMAAFTDEKGARIRAYYELVGMDRAICHHFCRQRLQPFSASTLETHLPIANINKMTVANRMEFRLFELRPVSDARVVSAIAWSADPKHPVKGFVAGFGTGPSPEKAALSAILECLRTATAVFLGGARPEESLDSLKARKSPWWHIWQAQTEESIRHLREHLLPGNPIAEPGLNPEAISLDDAVFTRLSDRDPVFDGIPLVVVRATSPKLIEPQFGSFRLTDAARQRFNAFNGGTISVDLSVPHFYG